MIASLISMTASLAVAAGQVALPPSAPLLSNDAGGDDWAGYGRTYDEQHYSPLTDINDGNVHRLGLAWSMDLPAQISTHSAPLAIDGVLYFAVGLTQIYAVDALSGRELWHYDAQVGSVAGNRLKAAWGIRGIAYWDGHVIAGTQDGRLISVHARTGELAWSTQTTSKGDGLYITGAPRVFGNRVIIGNGGADTNNARGFVTAYDAATGKQLWRFYIVPGNPALGFENEAMAMAAKTWTGQWWKYGGGGNAWNAMTYDQELDRIYIGTGNGAPWNQKIRSPGGGDNLFLSSILALDAQDGHYLWHYQTNPGETWDRNSAMDITLAKLSVDGKMRRVILHAPKNGFFYVIDRDSGRLISAEPFARQNWAVKIDQTTGRPIETTEARYPNGHAVIWPSGLGAHSWQAMSFSPKTGLAYIPTTELPGVFDDKDIDHKNWQRSSSGVLESGLNELDLEAPPPPPGSKFGHLQAWDPVTQTRRWTIPRTAPVNGGTAATAGNLVFEGTADGYFDAYAADTGKLLWRFYAQNGVIAQPITYRAGGRQYVTVLTGYSATAAIFGGISAQFHWNYRNQERRVLTFRLDAKAGLPPASAKNAPAQPLNLAFDESKAASDRHVYAQQCLACHGPGVVSGGTAPDLRYSTIVGDKDSFITFVRSGALVDSGMPKFDLSEGDILLVRNYILRQAARIRPSTSGTPKSCLSVTGGKLDCSNP
jgi:quinohemoprotein ethanol dehydrogenase